MKAFFPYTKDEANLRLLLSKLEKMGQMRCNFPTFCKAYNEWHCKTFPGISVNTSAVNFRDDWFLDFVRFLANYDVVENQFDDPELLKGNANGQD